MGPVPRLPARLRVLPPALGLALTLAVAGPLLVGGTTAALRRMPPPELDRSWDPTAPPAQAGPWTGPVPEGRLRAWAAAGSLEELDELRPLAGRPLVPVRVAGEAVALPEGLPALLAEGVDQPDLDATVALALSRAEAAVRDPAGLLAATPGLAPDLRARVAAGLREELATWGPRLTAGAPVGHRDRVLVQGHGRDAAWHLPANLAPHVEGRTYGAWLELLAGWYAARDIPAARFELGLPLDPTRPGDFPMEGWVAAWAAGQPPAADPFHALGRLQAVHLLARAGLVEVVFAGHGRQVRDPLDDADRLGAYHLGSLQRGDPCEELAILRAHRGGLSVRYGLCLPAGRELVSLSCSLSEDGLSGPQHSSAVLGWFLRNGAWPAFLAVEPVAFRIFPKLQQGQRAAVDPDGLGTAAVQALVSALPALVADRSPGGVASLGGGAWRLRLGGAGEEDLVVLDASVRQVDAAMSRRIALATTTWRLERAAPARTRRLAERVDLCARAEDCEPALTTLVGAGWPPPTEAGRGWSVPLAGGRAVVVAAPDATNPYLRLAVLRAPGEDDDAYLARAWRLSRGLRERRVLGLHLD